MCSVRMLDGYLLIGRYNELRVIKKKRPFWVILSKNSPVEHKLGGYSGVIVMVTDQMYAVGTDE